MLSVQICQVCTIFHYILCFLLEISLCIEGTIPPNNQIHILLYLCTMLFSPCIFSYLFYIMCIIYNKVYVLTTNQTLNPRPCVIIINIISILVYVQSIGCFFFQDTWCCLPTVDIMFFSSFFMVKRQPLADFSHGPKGSALVGSSYIHYHQPPSLCLSCAILIAVFQFSIRYLILS